MQSRIGEQSMYSGGLGANLEFEDTLTSEMRVALHDFVEVTTVANWCADECIHDPGMEECARVCRDIADLAALNVKFISRDSIYGAELAETFVAAAEDAEDVVVQHPEEHCQETAAALRRAIDSTLAMLDSFEHEPIAGQRQLGQY